MMHLFAVLLILAATLVVNTGKAIVTNRLRGAGTEPVFVAWGTGAGTTAATDTTLFTEASEARVTGTSSQFTTTTNNDTYRVVGTMTVAGSGKTITNAGLFDATSAGNLFFKSDFAGLPLNVGESIQFTLSVQLT